MIERPDGVRRSVMVYPHPLRDAQGGLIGTVNMLVDITEQKLAENTLKEAKEAAESASKAKDDLSHELRTPLNPALLLASERERDEQVPAELRDDFATIRKEIEMEARLIDDLLDLTRISRGKLRLEPRPIELHPLLNSSWERLKPEAAEKQLQVCFDLAANSLGWKRMRCGSSKSSGTSCATRSASLPPTAGS